MLLSLLLYLGFSLTAAAGVYWIAWDHRGHRVAIVSTALTLAFFAALAAVFFLWFVPELRSLEP